MEYGSRTVVMESIQTFRDFQGKVKDVFGDTRARVGFMVELGLSG